MKIREKTTLTLANFREIPEHDRNFKVNAGDVLFDDQGLKVEIIEPYGITKRLSHHLQGQHNRVLRLSCRRW